MRTYAVGYADLFSNDLVVTIETADSFVDAIKQRVLRDSENNEKEWMDDIPTNKEDIKQYFFDGDSLIGWTEIS